MLASTLSALTGTSPNNVQLGIYAAAVGSAYAAYTWYTMESPNLRVATEFKWDPKTSHAGEIVASVLKQQGVTHIFTLCGGHISPILVGCNQAQIKVIDVRHEANAAFAADCYSRLTGVPGVCAGLTNTVTAVKNAQVAQTPMVILGGATSDLLKDVLGCPPNHWRLTVILGRQSLQDIDQFALFAPHCKYMAHVKSVVDIVPMLEEAFFQALSGTPGPVFVEFPVDTLYPKPWLDEAMAKMLPPAKGFVANAAKWYFDRYQNGIFKNLETPIQIHHPREPSFPRHSSPQLHKVLNKLKEAKRPMLLLGSQTMLHPKLANELVAAVKKLGIPVWLQGMCRGLLGDDPLYMKMDRKAALVRTDCLIVCGVPFDFRSQYGMSVPLGRFVVCVNRNKTDLSLNADLKLWTTPSVAIQGDPCHFLLDLAKQASYSPERWFDWYKICREREDKKFADNAKMAEEETNFINPVKLCMEIDKVIADDSILIGDGGDFVATIAYNVQARGPLTWLDPGVFGTLGVGGGFAMAAKLVKPHSEVWLFWGDGACGFSMMEFDTLRRHNIPIIAVVGNDACWSQIHRDQVVAFNDDAGCALEYTEYDAVARALGCEGLSIDSTDQIAEVLLKAKELNAQGKTVLINAKIGKSDFRKGSLSA